MIIGSPKGLGNYNQKRGLKIKGLTYAILLICRKHYSIRRLKKQAANER